MATLVKRGTIAGDYHEHPINPVKIVIAALIVASVCSILAFFYFAHGHFIYARDNFDFWPYCWAALVRWPYFWQQHFIAILGAGVAGFVSHYGFWLWRNPKG